MKVLLVGDAHLDASTAGLARYDDVYKALQETIVVARQERVDAWCFLGDLTDPDSQRCHMATAASITIANHLGLVGISSFWLAGNHDVVEDGTGTTTLSPLKEACCEQIPAWVFDRPREYFFGGGKLLIVAFPFTARSHAYDPAAFVESSPDMEGPVLVLSHLNIEGIEPGSETADFPRGRDVFLPAEAIRQKWPQAFIASGHYHKRQDFNGVHVVGSLERLTFSEEGQEKGFTVLDL